MVNNGQFCAILSAETDFSLLLNDIEMGEGGVLDLWHFWERVMIFSGVPVQFVSDFRRTHSFDLPCVRTDRFKWPFIPADCNFVDE